MQLKQLPAKYTNQLFSRNLNLVIRQNNVRRWFRDTQSLKNESTLCIKSTEPASLYVRNNSSIELYKYSRKNKSYVCVVSQSGEKRFIPATYGRLIVDLNNNNFTSVGTAPKVPNLLKLMSYKVIPDYYGGGYSAQIADLILKYDQTNKTYNSVPLLSNQHSICLLADSYPAEDILNNAMIDLYRTTINKQNFLCVLNRPGDNRIQDLPSDKLLLNLTTNYPDINMSPTFAELLTYNDWEYTNPLGASELPVISSIKPIERSLSSEVMLSRDDKLRTDNYVLNIDQPVKLKSQVDVVSLINTGKISKLDANIDHAPFKPLPTNLATNLQPLLATILINSNPPINSNAELIYYNPSVLCMDDNVVLNNKLNNLHNLFFEYFQPNTDPLIDSSLKCIVKGQNGTDFQTDTQVGSVNLILPATIGGAQNINLGVTDEAIYPSGQIYANNTSYQISGGQLNTAGLISNTMAGTFINTTTLGVGSLVNGLSAANTSNPLTRNYTYWQSDFPSLMTSLVVGDAYPLSGSWGGTVPYAGIQYGSNEALRPAYFFTATPIISGNVNIPTTAEILLNGATTNTVDLPAGAFNLYNLPIVYGDGTVTVNVKNPNSDGFQSYTLPYYTSPKVLTNTAYLYQYNIGVPQLTPGVGWNVNGYNTNAAVAATQHFIGITNEYTMELRGEAQAGAFAAVGMSHNNIWFNRFATGLSAAYSQSESGSGGLVGFNIARQTSIPNTLGFGYNATYMTNNFNQLGMIQGPTYALQQTVFANYVASNRLTAALGYSNNSSITDTTQMQLYNMSLNWQLLKNLMLISSTSVTTQAGVSTFGSNLSMTLTFDGAQSLTGNYGYQQGAGNIANNYSLNYQYASPSNLWGYNVGGQYNDVQAADPTAVSAGGYYLFKNFNVNATGSYANNSNYGTGATISGNAVVGSNGVSFGQYSTLSYIIVKVGNLPNIGIKQNGGIVGSTDSNGYFVIPNIAAYLPQDIEVNASDLPFNIELDSYSKRVVAPLNGGARVEFVPVTYVSATALLRYGKNKTPPSGFTATLYNIADDSKPVEALYIVDNGMVALTKYSSKLNYRLEFTVKDGTYACNISKDNIVPADSNEYVTNLGTLQCTKK